MRLLLLLAALLAIAACPSVAFEKFDKWRPMTEIDWGAQPNEALDIHHAVILFDGTIIDERDLQYWTTHVSHYRRVRVFDEKGIEEFRTVEIPFTDQDRIIKLKARTLKPDGREIKVGRKDVYEKTLISHGWEEVKANIDAKRHL